MVEPVQTDAIELFGDQIGKDVALLNAAIKDIVKRLDKNLLPQGPGSASLEEIVEAVLRDDKIAEVLKAKSSNPDFLYVNEHLPREVQEDMMKKEPQMASHTEAIQKVLDEKMKPGMRVYMHGIVKASKLPATYKPERFGEANRAIVGNNGQPNASVSKYPINGAQPCLCLPILDDNEIDFNCVFIIDKAFQDGMHVAGYKGNSVIKNGGKWFTKAVIDVDPDKKACDDWAKALGKTETSVGLWPEKDRHTGASVKGTATDGFNTTTSPLEMSTHRNNQVDTSGLNFGGYPGETSGSHKFPQDNGTYAETWGTWRGGFIGHNASALVIYQVPEVSKKHRRISRIQVDRIYGRGFRTATVEIGLMGKPNGDPLYRYPNTEEEREAVYQYVPQNVYLYRVTAEDHYESGIQLNRGVNIYETFSYVNRIGHPNWSLNDYRQKGAPQVDPGYGTASGRCSPQINRHVMNGIYRDCARKGIDAHHGGDTYFEHNVIKAGVWGIQVAIEENQMDRFEDSGLNKLVSRWYVRDNVIESSMYGIDFINGAFSASTHKTREGQPLWQSRADVTIEDNRVSAPFGYRNNYNRGGFQLRNNTYAFGAPYGLVDGFNTSLFRAMWIGATIVNSSRGREPSICVVEGDKIYNSPEGNYATGIYVEAIDVLILDKVFIDTTPFTTDKLNGAVAPFTGLNTLRSGHETVPITHSSKTKITNFRVSNTFRHNMITGETKEMVVGGLSAEKALENAQLNGDTGPISPGPGSPQGSEPLAQPNVDGSQVPPHSSPEKDRAEEGEVMNEERPLEPPAQAVKEIKFSFENATNDKIVSDAGDVPFDLIKPPTIRFPDGTSVFAVTNESPRYIKTYANTPTSRAGVWAKVRGVNNKKATPTTVIMPLRINSFTSNTALYAVSPSTVDNKTSSPNEDVLFYKSKTQADSHLTVLKPENFKVTINGNAVKTNEEIQYNNGWMILTAQVATDAVDLALMSRYDGNGVGRCDIGEGLQIFPNKALSDEELQPIVTALKQKYGIS